MAVFTLAMPWLISVLLYACFRLLAFAPSGWLVWLYLVVFLSACLFGLSSGVLKFVTLSKLRRERKSAGLTLEPAEARVQADSAFKRFGLFHVSLWLMIPSVVSILAWDDIRDHPQAIKVNGQTRLLTQSESLNLAIRRLEERGVFTPYFRKESE